MHHNPPLSLEHIKETSFCLCKCFWRPPAHHKHTRSSTCSYSSGAWSQPVNWLPSRMCVCVRVCVCTAEPGLLRHSRHVSEPRLRRCSSFQQTDIWGGGEERWREWERMRQGGERWENTRGGEQHGEVMRRDLAKRKKVKGKWERGGEMRQWFDV